MNWKDILQTEYAEKLRLEWNVPLAKYTTFHIGGPAECFISARSSEEVQMVLRFCKEYQVDLHVLGNGFINNGIFPHRGNRGQFYHVCTQQIGTVGNGGFFAE